MNRRQRQVQQSLLNNELEVIKELEKSYNKAIKDIDRVITSLLARKDTENLQAIIYQLKYSSLCVKRSGMLLIRLLRRSDTLLDKL